MDPMEVDDVSEGFVNEGPIQALLRRKLAAVKASNRELQATIESTEAHIATLNDNSQESCLTIGSVCKKYHRGKWCFIVDITTSDSTKTYSNFNISIKWSPIITPTYTLAIYCKDAKDFVTETKIAHGIQLVIAFEQIAFATVGKFIVEIALFYSESTVAQPQLVANNINQLSPACDKTINKVDHCHVRLPQLEVGVAELVTNDGFTNTKLEVTNLHMINGDIEAMLTTMVCSTQIKLAMILSTTSSSSSFTHYLVIDCMFRELPMDFRNGCKSFLLNANLEHLDGCIMHYVDDDGVYLVDLFVRDKVHLHNVLHHIYLNIKGVNMKPLAWKSQLRKVKDGLETESEGFSSQEFGLSHRVKGDDVEAKKFGECLLRQIDSVIDFQQNVVENKHMGLECDVTDEYIVIRNALTLKEYASDEFYEKYNFG